MKFWLCLGNKDNSPDTSAKGGAGKYVSSFGLLCLSREVVNDETCDSLPTPEKSGIASLEMTKQWPREPNTLQSHRQSEDQQEEGESRRRMTSTIDRPRER